MTAKILKGCTALAVAIFAMTLGAGVSRAQYDNGPSLNQQQPQQQQKGKGAPPVNKPEEDAYKAFYAARSGPPPAQIQLGEAFVQKFPASHYLPGVYAQLTTDYYNTGDFDKMFASGTKAVELNPDNVDVLSLLAMAIPRRVKATTPDGAQQMAKAEEYAHHAIELIPNLTKPEALDDASFEKAKNEQLSMAHSGLGLIDINHQKWEDARTELMLAVQLAANPDPVDYYLLGNADQQASYLNGAIAAYEKCAATGPLMAQCRARSDSVKKDLGTALSKD